MATAREMGTWHRVSSTRCESSTPAARPKWRSNMGNSRSTTLPSAPRAARRFTHRNNWSASSISKWEPSTPSTNWIMPRRLQWYDKAAPLLTSQRPASELYAPRREGEMLVSMGVSYWQLGNQTRALDLTQTGVSLVEAAVENGVLAKTTLAVPYGNLATMYQQMGEEPNAAKYADLANSVAAPETKQSQRVGRQKSEKSRTR